MKRGGVKNTKKVCPWLYGWLRSSYCIDSSCFGILLLMQCSAVIKMRNLQFCVFPILSSAASFDHGHISLHATLLCRWDIYYLDRCHTSSCVRFYFWKNDALLNSYWYLSSLSEAERGSFQKQAAKQQNLQALPKQEGPRESFRLHKDLRIRNQRWIYKKNSGQRRRSPRVYTTEEKTSLYTSR